jgi:predicted nucleic acid-binding protein
VPSKLKKPCFDSSVFIGGLDNEIVNGIKRGVIFRYRWERAKAGDFEVYISALTTTEVYKTKRTLVQGEPLLDEFLEHVDESFVEVIEIDREAGLLAHALCRKFAANRLYPADACHLACAVHAACDVLLAWDGPLVSIQRYGSVQIEEPQIYDKTLFQESEIATAEEILEYQRKQTARKFEVVKKGK